MADVIIKGMEMRSACGGETDCFALDESGDYPMCRITGETRGYTFPVRERRMNNCPLRAGTELERLEKEREMLWRTVERLEKEREWISVEKPPRIGKRVILRAGAFVGEGYYTSAHTWWRITGMPMRDFTEQPVTHWMPLPEPPGEE